jgi:hypothetical protein
MNSAIPINCRRTWVARASAHPVFRAHWIPYREASSLHERSDMRDSVKAKTPDVAEPVIGRALARSVG